MSEGYRRTPEWGDFMKRKLAIALSAVMMLGLVACGDKKVGDGNVETKTPGTEVSDTEAAEDGVITATDGYGEGRQGDIMRTYFFDYTINDAYTCADLNNYVPADGKQLLVVNITVKNNSRASLEMYDRDFQAQWSGEGDDDYSWPITVAAEEAQATEDQFPGTYELAVDESRTGTLVYEVPMDERDFSISYKELFDNDTEGDTFFVYFTAKEQ